MVHVAGMLVACGGRARQRCAWCGALLVDFEHPNASGWYPLSFVRDDGTLVHAGDAVPVDSCVVLDPEVTR